MVLPQVHMMSAIPYEEEFPPLQTLTKEGSTQQPKILNPRAVEPDGSTKKIGPAEAVLNWQSENLIAQNKVLQKIDARLTQVDSKIDQSNIRLVNSHTILEKLENQVQLLHQELRRLAMTSSFSSRLFAEKEAEMKHEQPLPVVPQKEDHVKRLIRILDENDVLRKLKGKQKELPSSSQMMAQPQPQRQNPLTTMIKNHCEKVIPQVQTINPDTSSDEESVPEDSD
ncbi:hypothetical protein TIFTF001_031655 [Ficus carica]|uniref:Uncharacterized protein n=1 Tax=Ficus carica TaxID=3494 RepID=A0AA88DVC5_FICCA|nr:hypothetical protein TIFTF001_031655 [Ficus carica]